MTKVIFVSGFKSIPAGTEVTLSTNGVSYTGCGCVVNLTLKEINALASLGMVEIKEVADRVAFAPKTNSVAFSKITQAIIDDKAKYFIGEEYEFYNVEKNEFVVSKLLNTASHIGRIASGFAVPAGSSDNKKFNRLTKLNEVYGLGLSKSEITSATR